MKVSIIVPVYNGEKYLDKCMHSLLHQDFSDYEIILVNDGSKDNSSQLCHDYANKYTNVIVIDQENKKDGSARNNGVANSKAEYIMFVDADDYIDLDTLKETYKVAKEKDYDIVYFSSINEDENGKEIARYSTTENTRLYAASWKKLIKRSYIKVKAVENKYSSDLGFSMKLHNSGGKICYLKDKYFYHYVQYPTSIIHSFNPDVDLDDLYCLDDYKKWLIDNNKYIKDDFYFIVFREILIFRTSRILTNYPKQGKYVYKQLIKYCKDNIPDYTKQPFYQKESKKYKLLSFLFYHNLGFLFTIYHRLKND